MSLYTILKNKKYRFIFIFFIFIFIFLYFLFKNIVSAIKVFSFSFFTFSEKLRLFLLSFFDISELKDIKILILLLIFIISISLLFLLIFILLKERRKIEKKTGFLNTLFLFISILGLSCMSCGIGLLASLLSFFGFTSLILLLPLHGLEFTILGIISINISNYFLIKKIKNPFICN